MRIFLTGIGCVGRTMIGKQLGELLGIRFFDQRTTLQVDISGLNADQAVRKVNKVKEVIEELHV